MEDLLRVEVSTVFRTESTVGRSPAAVQVITQEDSRRSGATTFPELFRKVPGMNVARIDGNKWAVSARGFNDRFSNKLLVQVDGRTLYNPLFSGVLWDTVDYPLEDIDRIEVIRGPGASVWGANAVNGIINIITKSARETQGGLVSGGGGTNERGFGQFRYGGQISDNHYYHIYGKGFSRQPQFSETGDPNDQWRATSGGLRLDWQASQTDGVTIHGGYARTVAGRKDLHATADPTSVVTLSGITFPHTYLNVENVTTNLGHVVARWNHTAAERSSWSVQAYWDRVDRLSDNGLSDLRWDTFDVDFQHEVRLGGRQQVVYGLGYRYIDAFLGSSRRDGGFSLLHERRRRHPQLFSALVQDQISLADDRLSLTLGSKVEHNDFTGVEVQPTGRLLWTPTNWQAAWFAVSRAVRTPSFIEDELRLTLPPALPVFPRLAANREFQSEELLAYELGYRAQPTDRFSVDLAFFYNVNDNLGVRVPGSLTPGPVPGTVFLSLPSDNRMEGETYGAEVATNWQPTNAWRLYGAYTLLEADLRADPTLPAATRISAEAIADKSPKHQVYLQSSWNLPRNVEIDLIGRIVDRLHGFNPGGAPGVANAVERYGSLDTRVSYRPRANLELTLIGQNLLDAHHPEFGTSPTIRSPLVELHRGIYGKATWLF